MGPFITFESVNRLYLQRAMSSKPGPKCGVVFQHETHFYRHTKLCGEEQQHRVNCLECDKTFSRGDALKRHINTAHPVQKKFCCAICQKAFQYEIALHLHEERCEQTRLKPFK